MRVLFPSDVDAWSDIVRHLTNLQKLVYTSNVFYTLQEMYRIVHSDENSDQQEGSHKQKTKVFQGLENFFKKEATKEERNIFFQCTLPLIAAHALNIESLKPEDGMEFSQQQYGSCVSISRSLAASIVACGFLCLWPRRRYDKHSRLCSINFDNFFSHLSNKGQCGKLRCILHYFERTGQDPLQGNVIFERKVLPQENLPSTEAWLVCEARLCDITVQTRGRIEDEGPSTLQVDFANRKLGGAVLSTGRVQEEIRFSCCPELIAGQLIMEEMQDNEAIAVHGFLNYSAYTGYSKDLTFAGPFNDQAQRDAHGNLDNHLVAIDASPCRRIGGAEKQFVRSNILRDLNKAFIGFQQRRQMKGHTGSFGEIYKHYFSTLSEDILTEALGQVLTDYNAPQVASRRRYSAELPGSRRGSSESSRRGSQSTGSRRSSSRKSSSECSSDMEEYLQHLAARNSSHKPSVIEEEEVVPGAVADCSVADSLATKDSAAVAMAEAAPIADKLLTFSSECWAREAVLRPMPLVCTNRSNANSDHFLSGVNNLADTIVKDAMSEALEQVAVSRSKINKCQNIERYVEGLLEGTWQEVLQGINEGRVRVVQVDEESDTEDVDIDLFLFADGFVHGVLESALLQYADEVRAERRQLEAMWHRACEKMELEAKYFNAEFARGRSASNKNPMNRRKGSLNFAKGALAREMMRRRSLDETGWGNSRRRSSGFKNETLSSFENELIASNPNIPSLEVCAARRSSEPMAHGPDSIDADFLSVTSEQTRASSLASTGSSRELLLEWLNQSQATTSGRKRTSSSHLDWYAHDLVLDAFNAAFVDLFELDFVKSEAAVPDEAIQEAAATAAVQERCSTPPQFAARDAPDLAKTPQESPYPIVTGNWGCGAYRGDPQLKCLLQWMAASHVHAPLLIYNTFGEPALANAEQLCHLVSRRCTTVGQLMAHILHYCDNRSHYKPHSLFEILTQMLEIDTRPIC